MSCRILLVEDEGIVAADLELILSSLGHNVLGTVDNGLAAIQLAQTLTPEIIFMDIGLKGNLDGIEAALMIDSVLDKVIFIFTSAYRSQDHESSKFPRRYIRLQKPFAQRNIEEAIRRSHLLT
jgi:two-component SAPR family response regulator